MTANKVQNLPSMKPLVMNKADLETICCPLCTSENISILHGYELFKVVRCSRCGLTYLNPRLKEEVIKQYYQKNEYFSDRNSSGYGNYHDQEKSLRATFKKFLAEIQRRDITANKILEIGSGYGYFLSEAKKFFPEVFGTELSEEAAVHAQKNTESIIHVGELDTMPPEFINFDLIVAVNVIEHIYRPVDFLRSAGQRLKDGGRMVMATPDFGSFWHILMGNKWPSFKIPEHVTFYTRKTLTLLFKSAGFSSIMEVPFHHAFPLGLIVEKIGFNMPARLKAINIWLPKTMVALSAQLDRKGHSAV